MLFTLMLYAYIAQTQSIVLSSKEELLAVGRQVYFLKDPQHKFSIQDVLRADSAGAFTKQEHDVFVHPATEAAFWFKITTKNESEEDMWLDVNTTYAWYLDFYAASDVDNSYDTVLLTGQLRAPNSKAYPSNTFWLPLNKAKDTRARTYYIRIQSSMPFEAPFLVGTIRSLSQNKDTNDFLTAGFIGLMFIMFLYNLLLGISTRDRLYFYYIFYVLCYALGATYANNYSIYEFFPYQHWWYEQTGFLIASPILFVSLFSVHFLKIKKQLPWAYYLLNAQTLLVLTIGILGIFIPLIYVVNLIQPVVVSFYLTLLAIAYYLAWKQKREAQLYALGWTLMILSNILFIAVINGSVDYTPLTRNALYYGVSIEVCLFSIALGARYNAILKERQQTQQALLKKTREELATKAALLEKQHQIDMMEAAQRESKIILEQREILRGSIDNLPIFVAMLDKEGNYLVVNKLYEAVMGGTNALDVEGISYENIPLINTQTWRNELIRKALRGESSEFTQLVEFEGCRFYGFGRYTPVFDEQGAVKYVTVFVTDITSIIEKEQKLEELNATKDRIFSIIAHDLRSPLTTLSTMVGLFNDGLLSPEDIRPMMEGLAKSMNYTAQLVDNILYWAGTQLKGEMLFPKTFDINDLFDNNLALFEEQATAKNIRLSAQKCGAEAIAFADKDLVDLVLRNLLSNAMKFTPSGGSVELLLKRKDEDFWEIAVRDNGRGISAENLDKIFSGQLSSTEGTAQEKGTGLGLVLVKEFVQKNGGTISVSSALGQGSTFSFTVPLRLEN